VAQKWHNFVCLNFIKIISLSESVENM